MAEGNDQTVSLQGRRPVVDGGDILIFQAVPTVEEQSRAIDTVSTSRAHASVEGACLQSSSTRESSLLDSQVSSARVAS